MPVKRKFAAAMMTRKMRRTGLASNNRLRRAAAIVSSAARISGRSAPAKETGYVDLATADYVLDTTGSVTLLNTVAQGVAVTQRVGKKIQMKGLQHRGRYYNGTTATINDIAIMIVYDKRPTGSLPAITDILTSTSPSAMNNDANSGRFRILKRIDDVLAGNTTTPACGLEIKESSFYLSLRDTPPTVYKAAASGAISDIEEGALYLVTVGNTAGGTAAATLTGQFRLRFNDI